MTLAFLQRALSGAIVLAAIGAMALPDSLKGLSAAAVIVFAVARLVIA